MAVTGNESEPITLEEAVDMTTAYRSANPGATKAHLFGKIPVSDLLNQDNCVGVRAYYGIDDRGAKQLILVGVNGAGDDLTNGIILDRAVLCPDYCDNDSALS